MSCLDDVDGAGCGNDSDTKSQDESTTLQLSIAAIGCGKSIDNGTNDNEQSSADHSKSSTKAINNWPSEG